MSRKLLGILRKSAPGATDGVKGDSFLAVEGESRNQGLLILGILYAVLGFLILPRFDFCFNDDWVFTWLTKRFLETGSLAPTGFEAMYFSVQAVLGAASCILTGGFSYLGIHLVTFLLSFLAAAVFFVFLRDLGYGTPRAVAGSLLLVCNQIFFVNSFNFMTDVPAFAFGVSSIFFFSRGVLYKKDGLILLGSCLAVIGFFVRQFCILVSAAFALWIILNPEERRRLTVRRVLLLFGIPHVAGGLFGYWWLPAHSISRLPWTFSLEVFFLHYFYIILTLGFFVTPLLTAFLLSPGSWRKMSGSKWMGRLAAAFGIILVYKKQMFPFLRNQITAWGMFIPGEFIDGSRDRLFPDGMLLLLTFLSVVATAILGGFAINALGGLAREWRETGWSGVPDATASWDAFAARHFADPRTFLWLFSLIYAATLVLLTYPFDRYLLFLIPAVVVLALDVTREWRLPRWTTAAALAAYLLFSLIITLDTLSWNRAIWREARELLRTGVAPREIAGGWAWNGFSYLSGPAVPRERVKRAWSMGYSRTFPGSCDNYLFSFSPELKDFKVVKEIVYNGLPLREDRRIYLLAR